jgi:hypothetical protein
VDTLLDRGSEDLAATRSDRYLLILARLRALDAYDRAWGEDERVREASRNESRKESPRQVLAESER